MEQDLLLMESDLWVLILGAMHVALDTGFANEVLQTRNACEESCSVSMNASAPFNQHNASNNGTRKMLCSNGNTCPEHPNFYHTLFVATIFFTSWHAFFAIFSMYEVLKADTGRYSGNQRVSEAFEKKQFRVLLNGKVTLETFRMYRGMLVWSTESTLQHLKHSTRGFNP